MNNNERITELKNMIFYLQMKDRWDSEDYELSRKWNKELRELESTQA